MAEISGLKTLKQVVDETLFLAKKPNDEYFRYLQLAIRGFRDAKLFHLKGFHKVAKLTISAIKTITIPDDYISFIAVVVPINGEYWTLTEKGSMVFSQVGALDSDDGEGVDVDDSYNATYGQVGGINSQGYVTLDEASNRIVVNSVQSGRTEVMLLYISSGINESGTDTYIPDRVVPMIQFYILYKDAIMQGLPYQHLQDEYFREQDKVRYLEAPSFSSIRDAIYESITSTPTR